MKKRTCVLGYGKLHQRMEAASMARSRGGSISESLEIIEAMFDDLKKRQKGIKRALWLSVCRKFAFGIAAFESFIGSIEELVDRARFISRREFF